MLLCAQFGLHLLASSGTCPFRPEVALPAPLRRRRCGSTGRRRSSAARPDARDLVPASGSARLGEIAAPRPMTLTVRVLALRRPPCISERASSEVPGCGHASCRPLAARSQPRPVPRLWPRILRQPWDSFAMPRSEDRWRPACRPLATARSRRVTFHPYKGTERRRTVAAGSGEKSETRSGAAGAECLGTASHTTRVTAVLGDAQHVREGARALQHLPPKPPHLDPAALADPLAGPDTDGPWTPPRFITRRVAMSTSPTR
jgi:hypothetical protein